MKIKNTKELKFRAKSHAIQDHIRQGIYGEGNTNGKTEFRGCAVGCLSTPHRTKELRDHIIAHGKEVKNNYFIVDYNGEEQRKWIAEEFGINEALMILAEGFFEAQSWHGAAINFVKDFAYALPEGANITPHQVRSWAKKNLGLDYDGIQDYLEVGDAVNLLLQDMRHNPMFIEDLAYQSIITIKTKEFIAWLKSLAPEPVAA